MNQDYDVIILGLSRWDYTLGSTTLSFAKEFAKTNRVFYIDRPYSIKDYYSEKHLDTFAHRKNAIFKGRDIYKEVNTDGVSFIAVTPKVNLPINALPKGFLYNTFSALNDKSLDTVLNRIIKDYNVKEYIYINSFLPVNYKVIPKKIKQPIANIYQSVDDISQESYIAKHGIMHEKIAVQKCDIAIASSIELCRRLTTNIKKVHLIPNAADTSLFNSTFNKNIPKPLEIQQAKGKIIIFTGNLNSLRMDYALLAKIAEQRPNDTLLIIGPYSEEDYQKYNFANYSNMVFTGRKPIETLPDYLRFADCAIIPFLKNQLTKSIYPLKINEYLAAGLPVVTTDFSPDIESFAHVVYMATDNQSFLQQIQKSMDENNEEKKLQRVNESKNNTWEDRVKRLKKLVTEYVSNQ